MLDHLMPLPGGSWALWRSVVLRGAGFPAERVLSLGAPDCAAAADRKVELEERLESLRQRALRLVNQELDELRASGAWDDTDRRKPLLRAIQALNKAKAPKGLGNGELGAVCESLRKTKAKLLDADSGFERSFETDRAELSREIRRVLGWDLFQEAVTWQNRQAMATVLGTLGERRHKSKRTSQRRQHEEMVANYLQRYCLKNDTVGFFGPVGWTRLVSEGDPVTVRPGARLLASREVYFENWAIDALARKLGREPSMRPWLAPRLRSSFYLESDTLYAPFRPTLKLSPAEARLLADCDGRRTAKEIAAGLIEDPAVHLNSEAEVFELLEKFCKKRVALWSLEVPMELYPERSLRRQLERVGDEETRAPALAALAELEDARGRVARAAGDAAALDTALRQLEETFTRLTGQASQRHHGQTYAARSVVYEDCRRAVEIELGPELVRRLGPPLTLVLKSGRWLAGEMTRRVEDELRAIYVGLRKRTGSDLVDSVSLVSQAISSLFLKETSACFTAIEEEFQARWSRVLNLDPDTRERRVRFSAAELRAGVEREFGAAGPTWSFARYFGPDVMIAAASEEEIGRGNFEIVLGEIHATNCMAWSCFVSQHPAPQELLRCVELDMDLSFDMASQPVVMPLPPKQMLTQRMAVSLMLPRFFIYKYGDDPPDHSRGRILPAGSVVVDDTAEGLMARTRDGRVRFSAVELLGSYLTDECNGILGTILRSAKHKPRVTFDNVVVSRERWSFAAAAAAELAAVREPKARFLAVRRWAHGHGMPRFCFYKFSCERKPCYLDFASPIYVDLFLKMLRTACRADSEGETFWLTEMLPRTDQTWLTDAEGRRYTCELRMAGYDCSPS